MIHCNKNVFFYKGRKWQECSNYHKNVYPMLFIKEFRYLFLYISTHSHEIKDDLKYEGITVGFSMALDWEDRSMLSSLTHCVVQS